MNYFKASGKRGASSADSSPEACTKSPWGTYSQDSPKSASKSSKSVIMTSPFPSTSEGRKVHVPSSREAAGSKLQALG